MRGALDAQMIFSWAVLVLTSVRMRVPATRDDHVGAEALADGPSCAAGASGAAPGGR